MTRDETLGLIAAALAATVSTIMCAACLVGMHAGVAQAEQADEPEAREAAFEPPEEPEPEPCGLTVDQASEEAWEEPVYCETQYVEPAYVEPAYVEPVYYEPVCAETAYAEPTLAYEPAVDPSEVDLKTAGVVYDGGTRYTWYSERVLPGGGLTELNENGRAHDEAGHVVDADGYIAVASSDHEKGTVLDTPWGVAKVYDCGCDSGTVDIYTQW